MGRPIGIDSMVLVYYLEEHHDFWAKSEQILKKIISGENQGILSIIGIIEILSGPKKKKSWKVVGKYKKLLYTFPHLIINTIDENIAEISSDLRAKYDISTQDAIHIATAIAGGAEKFITNDEKLKKIKEIKISLIKDITSAPVV